MDDGGVRVSRRTKQQAQARRAALPRFGEDRLPPWTPFEEMPPVMPTREKLEALAAIAGKTPEAIESYIVADMLGATFWNNSRYYVIKKKEPRADGLGWVWHLSFRRQDRMPVGREHFRDFQRIKNELLGPQATAIEIYPAEDRLADTSNQYHLWAYDDLHGFPFGFYDRAVLDAGQGLVQKPLDEDA